MKNILLVLKQEYYTRVTKKSFIIMTLLGPLLMALFYGSIGWIASSEFNKHEKVSIALVDSTNNWIIKKNENEQFIFNQVANKQDALSNIRTEDREGLYDVIIFPQSNANDSLTLLSAKSISITEKGQIKSILESSISAMRLKQLGISQSKLDSLEVSINLKSELLSGKNSATEIRSGIGYVAAFIIYLFIFMYGVMIMRSVTEEKNSRIIELIVSAVRPYQLMMGKILGVALVGLTQFIAWILLTVLLISIITMAMGSGGGVEIQQASQIAASANASSVPFVAELLQQLSSLNYLKIVIGFILFFTGGYLLYSAMFAAIGSAVDSDTETQQFMFPISMPLIFGLIIAQIAVVKDPNSTLAVWASMIPFTSPVVMMVRLPFDVSWTELAFSAILLFSTFFIIVWLAAKIYRIGILSYGQKVSYKQLWKWLFIKN